MIVAKLIQALQKMPQDAKVILVNTQIGPGKWDNEVRDVIYNDPSKVRQEDKHTVELDNWPAIGYLRHTQKGN